MEKDHPDRSDDSDGVVPQQLPVPNVPTLREWNSLNYFLSKIPEKAQKGFQTLDLCLTCIAVLPDYLVVGTNVGLIYWYNRKCDSLERLKIEGTTSSITCISVVSSVDYMVAAGNEYGIINIFQVPKLLDQDGNLQETESLNHRRVQIYTVRDLHKCSISALEWSSNGMKLFSGDISGLIVITEIDFGLTISKSSKLLDEKFKIVQLSYAQHNLLISTTFRSILYTIDLNGSYTKLGSQDRKMQGCFGATYEPGVWKRSRKMYVTRPGGRLWIVGLDGHVQKTIIFKDLLCKGLPKVPLLNSSTTVNSKDKNMDSDIQLGKLFNFMENYLVTFHKKNLYILDPVNVSIIGTCLNLQSVIDVGVSQDEIFILETHRNIIRISIKPDEAIPSIPIPNDISFSNIPDLVTSTIPDFKVHEQTFNFIASKIKETSRAIPKINSSIFNSIKSVLESDANIQDGLIEDLPQIVPLKEQDIPKITTTNYNEDSSTTESPHQVDHSVRKFDSISNESYADALLKQYKPDPKRKKNRKAIKLKNSNSDAVSLSSQYSSNSEGEVGYGSESQRKLSTDSSGGTPLSKPTFETFQKDNIPNEKELKSKEEMLAKLLNWAELMPDYISPERPDFPTTSTKPSSFNFIQEDNDNILQDISETQSTSSLETVKLSNGKSEMSELDEIRHEDKLSETESEEDLTEHQLDSSLDIYTKYKSFSSEQNSITSTTDFFGPPSGSSSRNVTEGYQSSVLESSIEQTVEQSLHNATEPGTPIQDMTSEGSPCNQNEHWIQYSLPCALGNLTACDNYIICIDSTNNVYFSRLREISLRWVKTDYSASQMALTPDGSILWRIDPKGKLLTLRSPSQNGPYTETDGDWEEICDSVTCCAIGYTFGCIVKNDKALLTCLISPEILVPTFEVLSTPWEVSQVSVLRNCLWALTKDGRVLYRSGYSQQNPFGDLWNELRLNIQPIASLSFGPSNSVWLADILNNLHFISGVTERWPGGSNYVWNVTINDVIFATKPSSSPYSLAHQLKQRLKDPLKTHLSFLQCRSPPVVSGSLSNIWFSLKNLNTVHVNKKSLIGHRWETVPMEGCLKNVKFTEIFAESIYKNHGFLWLTDVKGKLCYMKAGKSRLQPIDTPCNDLVHLASAPEALWVLSSKGKIYARCNMNSKNELGNGWDQIQLSPLADNVQIVHMSCGSEVVWACDSKGHVYIRSGCLEPPSTTDMCPAWVQVENSMSDSSIVITKVYVGSNRHVVWAIDNKQNIYAREAIYPDLPIGTAWVLVPAIEAVSLAVSDTGVWALSPKGEIFRRYGVSETNFVGDCWRKIPGSAKILTVSVCDELWALDSAGTLHKHYSELLSFDSTSTVTSKKSFDEEDAEWELV